MLPLVPIALAVLGVLLVIYFDLQTNLPFLDETARRWTIQRLVDGHGLVLLGLSPNFVESVVALPAALLHLEPRYWRLAGIPFLAMAGVYGWLIAIRLGADRFWAAVAAAVLVANPIGLSLATGMMTETAFVGLLMAATYFCLQWVSDGKSISWAVLLVVLCTLQRQQGLALAIVVTAGLMWARSRRPITGGDLVGLGGLWLGVLAAVGIVELILRLAPLGETVPTGPAPDPHYLLINSVTALPLLAGLLLVPLAAALIQRPHEEAGMSGWIELAPVGLGVAGLLFAAVATFGLSRSDFFLGDYWTRLGLGPHTAGAPKPALLSVPIFLAIEAITVLSFVVVLVWRRKIWRPSILGTEGCLLLLLALIQFAVIPQHGSLIDRYYLLVIAPLVPLLAAVGSRSAGSRWAKAAAVGAIGAWILVFAVGEQDYQAWQVARDKAAQLIYAQYPADAVDGGFEENVVHVGLAAMEDTTGKLPREFRKRIVARLAFASTNDPRPGFTYSSFAPGKIVIEVIDPSLP